MTPPSFWNAIAASADCQVISLDHSLSIRGFSSIALMVAGREAQATCILGVRPAVGRQRASMRHTRCTRQISIDIGPNASETFAAASRGEDCFAFLRRTIFLASVLSRIIAAL